MLPTEERPVQAAESEGVSVSAETPVQPQSGVSHETPVQPAVDVEKMKAEYESKLQRFEQDMNRMKSSLQKQTSQVEKEWQQRNAELQRQLHETRMSTMTVEERARYERQLESEEFQTLQSRLAELENERARQVETVNAYSFFIQQGVPADRLNLAEGYDGVVNAGWQYLIEERNQLKAQLSNPSPSKPVEPAPLRPAPVVVTDKGIPATGTTWAALVAQYGSRETVYRAVEEGRLPASIIPLEG